MFRSTVKTFNRFPEVTDRVRVASKHALDRAARRAAEVAQDNASIGLEVRTSSAAGDVEGYSAGIRAERITDVEGRTTPIAYFFDTGTLGHHKKRLKRGRKRSWTQRNPRSKETHVANRGDVDGKGIPAEHFFPKAQRAGRKELLADLEQQLGTKL